MEKRKLNVAQSWAKVVRLLLLLEKAWEEHRGIWIETPRRELDLLPPETQRFVVRNFNRSKFDIMLPRLVRFWRTIGGIKALQITLIKEKEEEKENK